MNRVVDKRDLGHAAAPRGRDDAAVMVKKSTDGDVLRGYVRDEPVESAGVGGLQHATGEFGADSLPLPVVPNNQAHFHAAIVECEEIAKSNDLLSVLCVQHRDQRQRSTVVDTRQHAYDWFGRSRQVREKPQVSRAGTQRVAKGADSALVVFTQETYSKRSSVRQNDQLITCSSHTSVNRQSPPNIPSRVPRHYTSTAPRVRVCHCWSACTNASSSCSFRSDTAQNDIPLRIQCRT